MPKSLVLCCDGTWNTPDQKRPTNVTKVALAVAETNDSGEPQRTLYHRGVGSSVGERFRGGAFGYGLSRNVRQVYRFLVENYEPGDRLYFFGFSRGAFTARSTAGFVRNCGILRRSESDRVDEAYDLYRSKKPGTRPRSVEASLFRRAYSHEPRIRFIGVWDTVGALGVPLNGLLLSSWINRRWQFHDTELSSHVDAAFHALAIDEQRGPFEPTLWTRQPEARAQQVLEQVWFSGVHCDVGGGNPEHGLSDIPLLWMVSRARGCGLRFTPEAFTRGVDSTSSETEQLTRVAPDPLAGFSDSRTGMYRCIRRHRRTLGTSHRGNEFVSSSALFRLQTLPDYRPVGLDGYPERDQPPVMTVESANP
ncbi:DUF2235 domain-containing protein [Mycobacterium sp. SMC-4]|uniref:DUF2235 domain-containing protein n=1 Tax=Mycobacterium sp. SMC-4 TaxID=2857059 RepID=UPI003CFE5129